MWLLLFSLVCGLVAGLLWRMLRGTTTDSIAPDPRIERIVVGQRRVESVLVWFVAGLGALSFVIGVVQLAGD